MNFRNNIFTHVNITESGVLIRPQLQESLSGNWTAAAVVTVISSAQARARTLSHKTRILGRVATNIVFNSSRWDTFTMVFHGKKFDRKVITDNAI